MTTTAEQQAVIDSDAPAILVAAGAGSGKSRVLVERIKRLVRDGTDPARIVAISFTVSASAVLQERLGDVKLGCNSTLHSFIFSLLNRYGGLVGLCPPISIVDEDEAEALLADAMEEMASRESVKKVKEEVAKGPKARVNPMTRTEIVAEAFYQKLKADNVMTFDSLLYWGERLLNVMRAKGIEVPFDHILVDENQDLSDQDWRLIEGANISNLFSTGDFDQSVFAFRGARPENILRLANTSTVFRLEQNWRSGSSICEHAQRLIEHSPARLPKRTISATGTRGEVRVMADGFETDDAEAHEVAQDIAFLNKDKAAYNDCAVLVRTNALADFFRGVLKAHGLPVREPKRADLPADWSRAKASLAMLTNPDNDRLSYVAIRLASGRDKADEVRRRALAEYKTINDLALHMHWPALSAADALGELARMGVSRASLDRIGKSAAILPPEAGVADLVLAVGRETVDETEGEGVTISTGHKAKGAEWRAVWCPAWESETMNRKGADEAEERRLAFVMITRAAERLWISWAKKRAQQWGGKECRASQFVTEIVTEVTQPDRTSAKAL